MRIYRQAFSSKNRFQILLGLLAIVAVGCSEDSTIDPPETIEDPIFSIPYDPTPYNLQIPDGFPNMKIPDDNQMTAQGVELGRHLFYDPILSADSTMSCSTCHLPSGNFSDNRALSLGIDGIFGERSSMTLLNIGFVETGLFWDGSVQTLEEQALVPVEDPVELHHMWPEVEAQLQRSTRYKTLFRKAFGIQDITDITRELAVKAIAQFERTIISSGNSKYDRVIAGQDVFTDQELEGYEIFFDINPDITRHAECGHCHNAPLFTTNEYFNNGLTETNELTEFPDLGRGLVTGKLFDNGTFRTPTLRNIELSAPYMHDGRFSTLEEVLDHYSSGGHPSKNVGVVLRELSLSDDDRQALLAFISTLQDSNIVVNPSFLSPFE